MHTICGWAIRGFWLIVLMIVSLVVGNAIIEAGWAPHGSAGFMRVVLSVPFMIILLFDLDRAMRAQQAREEALSINFTPEADEIAPESEQPDEEAQSASPSTAVTILAIIGVVRFLRRDSVQSVLWEAAFWVLAIAVVFLSYELVSTALRNGYLAGKIRQAKKQGPKVRHYAWASSPLFAVGAIVLAAAVPSWFFRGLYFMPTVNASAYDEFIVHTNDSDDTVDMLENLESWNINFEPVVGFLADIPDGPLAHAYVISVPNSRQASAMKLVNAADGAIDQIDIDAPVAPADLGLDNCSPPGTRLYNHRDPLEAMDIYALHSAVQSNMREQVRLAVVDDGVDKKAVRARIKQVPVEVFDAFDQPKSEHGSLMALVASYSTAFNDRVTILDVPALATGEPSSHEVVAGIARAVDAGAKVINMSFAGRNGRAARAVSDAVEYAIRHDVVLVAAAGNQNRFEPSWPASIPAVLAVGAGPGDYGNDVGNKENGVTAPVSGYCLKNRAGTYRGGSGTSFGSSAVASALAMIRSACPDAKGHQVTKAATTTRAFNALTTYQVLQLNGLCN